MPRSLGQEWAAGGQTWGRITTAEPAPDFPPVP
jgi:hypothetical protein